MIVVPDAGPLIYLGGANELELLRKLYDEVVVPRVVHDEVVVAGVGLPGAREVGACRWIRVQDVAPIASVPLSQLETLSAATPSCLARSVSAHPMVCRRKRISSGASRARLLTRAPASTW